MRFLRDICDTDGVLSGKFDAEKYFNETTIYKKQVFLDAPNGLFEGIKGINNFAGKWMADFKAKKAEVYPVIQTIANGRICNELEIWFYRTDGEVRKVPMTIFSDPIGEDKLEGMRIYFFFKFLDGSIAYRRPIFRPRFTSWAEPPIMTGVIRYYYEQLHNFRSAEAINNIVEMCTDDVHYGGYRPDADEPLFIGKEALRKVYEGHHGKLSLQQLRPF